MAGAIIVRAVVGFSGVDVMEAAVDVIAVECDSQIDCTNLDRFPLSPSSEVGKYSLISYALGSDRRTWAQI